MQDDVLMPACQSRGKATSTDGDGTPLSTLTMMIDDRPVIYATSLNNLGDLDYHEGVYRIDIDKFKQSEAVILGGNEWPVILLPFKKIPGVDK